MTNYEKYLILPGKTEPKISIFEHCNDVFQALCYLIKNNESTIKNADLIKLAALLHDVGKIKQEYKNDQWIHTPYTAEYLDDILSNHQFQIILHENGISTDVNRQILLQICEEHHNPSPNLLRMCKEALLVSIADALASCIENGTVGNIRELLRTNPYIQINLELVKSLNLDKGLDAEVHRIDLPSNFVEDVLLANMIYLDFATKLQEEGMHILLQKNASLWVVGQVARLWQLIKSHFTGPSQLYNKSFTPQIYESLLSAMPQLSADKLKFIIVNEQIARRLMLQYIQRKRISAIFEKYDIDIKSVTNYLSTLPLEDGVNSAWKEVMEKIIKLMGNANCNLPLVLSLNTNNKIVDKVRCDGCKRTVDTYIKTKGSKHKCSKDQVALTKDIGDLLKLFDSSTNGYWSICNIYLEYQKMRQYIDTGKFNLKLEQVAHIDGVAEEREKIIENSKLCPRCKRFKQEFQAQAIITGSPKTDNAFHLLHSTDKTKRGMMKVCRYCFVAGYMDLPLARIYKETPTSQSLSKDREYLFIVSPLPRNTLQHLINFISTRRAEKEAEMGDVEGEQIEAEITEENLKELEELIGFDGYDTLSVLGLSKKRLSNLKGMVLPSLNCLNNLVGIRMPFERLFGEDKVSWAAKRELIKATMYDFYQATQSGSIHYNVLTEHQFSVNGQSVSLEDMYRANVAYRIADRYARGGKYAILDSSIFLLLLSNPRQAVTLILRKKRREGRGQYAPGEDRIKEVIEMAEEIAKGDWKSNLGLKITEALVNLDLLPKARSFWKPGEQKFTGVELVKWLRRLKMVKDEASAKAWGNSLINALKRGDVASREFRQKKGIPIEPPNEEKIAKVITLVGEIIRECKSHNYKLSDFSRDIADMDYGSSPNRVGKIGHRIS